MSYLKGTELEGDKVAEKLFNRKFDQSSDWLDNEKETILIYGPPKCGKTWAYCSYVERTIKKGGMVYIINTDGGVSKTLKQYFGDKLGDVKDKLKYYFISDADDGRLVASEVSTIVKPNDLVIIDLISDFWDMAQGQFINDISGGEPINYIVKASKDTKKFGLFAGSQWQYIKRLHDYITTPFTARTTCNVIAVAAQKNLDIEKSMSGGKTKHAEYEAAGARPAGATNLTYQFNTIIYINKTDKGDKRYFQIMGDRGAITNQKMVTFDKNFAESYEAERNKKYEAK